MSDDPTRLVLKLRVTDAIAPGEDSITLDSYVRLLAEMDRTGMSIDEVLDDLIVRTLPPAPHN